MAKLPVSVTLDESNIVWLRARARAGQARNLSDALDRIVSDARQSGRRAGARSVAGTIDIAAADPGLDTADAVVRSMFDAYLPAQTGTAPATAPARARRTSRRTTKGRARG